MKLSPLLAYLAAQPWAMDLAVYERMVALFQAHAAGEKIDAETIAGFKAAAAADPASAEPGMQWSGKTAIIPVRGVLARYSSSVNGMCQPQGRSAEAIQADILAAAERGAERIILRIDSPGGEVAGTAETARILAGLPDSIQTVAFLDGTAASAAYWIASQANKVIAASPTTLVGSIGVAMSVPSGSGGRTTITSAPAKSAPTANDAHLANARQMVADMAGAFADAVAAGRGMSEEDALKVATGEVWTADRALALGLVDGIASWSDVLAGTEPKPDPSIERRRSMAGRLAATVTVSGRGAPSAEAAPAASDLSSTPAAAHQGQAPSEHPIVDPKLMATLAALCQTHTTHAAALVAEANKPGATEQALHAFLSAKVSEAKDAEIADLKARAEKAEKAAAEATEAKAKAEGELAKIKAHKAPEDPGGDGPDANARKIPLASADRLSAQDVADIKAGKAVLV